MDVASYAELVGRVADLLEEYDRDRPVYKTYQPGIGPFAEPRLVKDLARLLREEGISAKTQQKPDLNVQDGAWGIECKIVRPFGDNNRLAENWSINLLHPYPGHESLIGDGLKLRGLEGFERKGLLAFGFEHDPVEVSLDPLVDSFELVATRVCGVSLGPRIEEVRRGLVHPVHQVLRCFGWEVLPTRGEKPHNSVALSLNTGHIDRGEIA